MIPLEPNSGVHATSSASSAGTVCSNSSPSGSLQVIKSETSPYSYCNSYPTASDMQVGYGVIGPNLNVVTSSGLSINQTIEVPVSVSHHISNHHLASHSMNQNSMIIPASQNNSSECSGISNMTGPPSKRPRRLQSSQNSEEDGSDFGNYYGENQSWGGSDVSDSGLGSPHVLPSVKIKTEAGRCDDNQSLGNSPHHQSHNHQPHHHHHHHHHLHHHHQQQATKIREGKLNKITYYLPLTN